ncbi:hypothetical protein GTY67_03090 [Streptomyces sp. SID8374]|uniref:hypothetical protein n=1 Tax=unclassified Streptomyces TaxID=2593676 RepID=UPI00081DC97C|nr:hypothetical protein [Streptomyces sp. ScaeMP-e83]MYR98634.1 hypothetical protein [Streptomyces sp. SID4937]MYX12416.1 hypothetical protein [Streptomyces sp. SID8374]SCE40331.1 hypothetical protein GA0115243_1116153 [Streptomyces sp. ScaeMP-e83]
MVEQQEASSEDAVMTRIGQAVMLLHGGDREEARNRFGLLWSELGADGDGLHRCTLAHYMADTQDDPGDELAWDLRALTAAEGLMGGERPAEHRDSLAVQALYPSLHLNLAADYLKLQRPDAARIHLRQARDAADALEDGDRGAYGGHSGYAGYDGGVRAAIERLELRMRGM